MPIPPAFRMTGVTAFLLGGCVPAIALFFGQGIAITLGAILVGPPPLVILPSHWPYFVVPLGMYVAASFFVGWLLRRRREAWFASTGLLSVSLVEFFYSFPLNWKLEEVIDAFWIIPGLSTVFGLIALHFGNFWGTQR